MHTTSTANFPQNFLAQEFVEKTHDSYSTRHEYDEDPLALIEERSNKTILDLEDHLNNDLQT